MALSPVVTLVLLVALVTFSGLRFFSGLIYVSRPLFFDILVAFVDLVDKVT